MKFFIAFTVVLAVASANHEHEGYEFEVQHHEVGPQARHHYLQEQVQQQTHHNLQEIAQSEDKNENEHQHHEDHEDEHYVDYVGHPKYHYEYAVHDPHTHDVKNQWEARDGKHVKGEYNVVQPDGKTRTVKYESDGKHGIKYDVKYEGGHY